MTIDQRAEIPGFHFFELPAIGARMPIPNTWLYTGVEAVNQGSHLALAERNPNWVQIKKGVVGETHIFVPTPPAKGDPIPVSMAVYLMADVVGTPVEGLIDKFLRSPYENVIGISSIEADKKRSLEIEKAFFVSPRELTVLVEDPEEKARYILQIPPSHFNVMTMKNMVNKAAGFAFFTAPSLEWKHYRRIAETMIDNVEPSLDLTPRPTPN